MTDQTDVVDFATPLSTRAVGATSPATFAFGVVSYFVGVLGLVALILKAGGLMPFQGPVFTAGTAGAAAVNVALILLWGVQHSVMARPWFKRRWTRIIPEGTERPFYVLASGIAAGIAVGFWQPLAGIVWESRGALRIALWVAFFGGWAYLLAATFAINHFDLFGLRQAWLAARGRPYTNVPFSERAMYRYSRHPIMAGALVGFWAVPTMTASTLALALLMTAYVAVGVSLEERDLMGSFGARYADYRRRVGAFFTIPGRADRD